MTTFAATGTGRTGSTQDYTVPSTASYEITAFGARGGNGNNSGGYGTSMVGEFSLTAGHVIRFMVGHTGGDTSGLQAGGGGGGTFVYNVTTSTILLVAGGGGGGGWQVSQAVRHAVTTTTGANGGGSSSYGAGGVGPSGGGGGNYGGGGGGFSGNGGNSSSVTYAYGGSRYTSGGTGGLRYTSWSNTADGGYGGGGGSSKSGGGGGGYGGGGGGKYLYGGGGGGSYNAGISQTNTVQAGTAAGSAQILKLNAPPTAPTPLTPADNATVALTSGVSFTYTHNDAEGDAQVGYALKRRAVTLGDGIIYAAEEWWNGTTWVSTTTTVASSTQPVATTGWPAIGDTYQYAIATSDAVGISTYSAWSTINPYEWWNGTAWVPMTEGWNVSTTSAVTLSIVEAGLVDGTSYSWAAATKDSAPTVNTGPYAAFSTFTAGGSVAHIWNGTAWVDHEVLVWDGSAWVTHTTQIWDGSAWQDY